jgi:hypothetical protein
MAQSDNVKASHPKATPWMLVVGCTLILAGVGINWLAMRRTNGFDFNYLYVLAKMVGSGQNAYNFAARSAVTQSCCNIESLELQPYPPATGIILLPFSVPPVEPARALWFLVSLATLLAGIAALVRTLEPDLDTGKIAIILGLVSCSSCVRWGFTILQAAPLLAGLFALFAAALLRGRPSLALAPAVLAIGLKPTYVLPFVALFLLQRRFSHTAILIGAVLLINLAGFARMGGMEAVTSYRADIAKAQLPSRINHPDPHNPLSVERVDWLYAINAVHSDVPLSKKAGNALTLLSVVWLVWEGIRVRRFAREEGALRAFLGPVACLGTLFIYHNHYETVLLLVPALAYLYGPTSLRNLKPVWWFLVPLAAYISVYPVAKVSIYAQTHFSPNGFAYAKAIGSFVVLIVYIASLAALHAYISARRTSDSSPT